MEFCYIIIIPLTTLCGFYEKSFCFVCLCSKLTFSLMNNNNKMRRSNRTSNNPKRPKINEVEHFSQTSSQSIDLHLRTLKHNEQFRLSQIDLPRAIDFLKLLLDISFLKILFPSQTLLSLSPYGSFDFFWVFMAAWISMGIIRLPNINSHFQRHRFFENRITTHFISKHLFNNTLQKMTGDVFKLSKQFQKNIHKLYTPTTKCSIDETILSFTGKSNLKVTVVGKPHPNGVKLYTLVDECGILLGYIIYKKEKITIYNIFKKLLNPFENRSLKIYADKWFGSEGAIQYCVENNHKFLFAMQKNRPKKLWLRMYETTMKNGHTMMWHQKENSIRAISLKQGNRIFNFITNHIEPCSNKNNNNNNILSNSLRSIEVNHLLQDYNYNMKRVDQFNQTFYLHLPLIRQQKEVVGIRRAILRFAVVNAYRMYERYYNTKIQQVVFLEMLMYELIGFSKEGWASFLKIRHVSLNKSARCVECLKNKIYSNCTHWCSSCKARECTSCFNKKHIK